MYGIMQNVSTLSGQRVTLGSCTLYGAINTLLEKEWIVLCTTSTTARKKEYIITSIGINILNNELIRLEELIQNGKVLLGGHS